MKTSTNSFYWFSLFAFCFVSYQQIIDNIRPNYLGNNWAVRYLLGIAPNFFPAIGIPALFVVLLPQLKPTNKWLSEKKHIRANAISLVGLITWEVIQTTSTKLHFDWNDILWAIIGALVFQFIWTVSPDRFKENPEGA